VWGVFYKSTDGGQTWTRGQEGIFPSYPLRANIVVNPANANDVWLVFPRNGDKVDGNRLFRSTNGGATFAPVTTLVSASFAAFGKGQSGTTPALYVLGRVGSATKDAFYRSDDLGATWTRISDLGWSGIMDIDADPRTYGVVYAATGGRGIVRGRAGATAGDTARYSFESSTQNWGVAWGNVTGVATSTAQKSAGTRSLAVTVSNAAAGTNTTGVRVLNNGTSATPMPPAGATVTARVWVPSGAPITRIHLFSQGKNWEWYAGSAAPVGGGWATITFTMPSGANVPANSVGVGFDLSAAWSGTVYVDSVNW
jgi:hypothetical protein